MPEGVQLPRRARVLVRQPARAQACIEDFVHGFRTDCLDPRAWGSEEGSRGAKGVRNSAIRPRLSSGRAADS
jgi:hypothetical protein